MDALTTREMTCVQDGAGLSHVAIPLFLGDQPLGALIAGQTFAQYPQPLRLQRVAKYLGASQRELWSSAVHQVPVSPGTLFVYADLLKSLGRAFLRQRYSAILARKLHETDQRYQLMIEGSNNQGLFTIDGAGSITNWNNGAERLFGYAESEIKHQDYSRLFTPEDILGGIDKRDIRMAEQSGWIEEEGWQVRKDGTRFLSKTVTARLGQADAREYGRLLHDVTEEREAAEEVLQAQKLESIGVLAGGIAHDFNNLLTGILGGVSLVRAALAPDDPLREVLAMAERSSLKAAELVSQLLAYAGKGALDVTRFDLSRLVSEILPLIRTSIPSAVQLELSLAAGLPWVEADSSEIQRVIMNLVINGAEAMDVIGGNLRVSTGSSPRGIDREDLQESVYFEVRDLGCGMDEETRKRIFEPFFTTKFSRRGLGLAAVSGIVRRLNGRLDVKSALGEGSTFRVTLPTVPSQLPALKVPPKSAPQGTGVILVVDDDPVIRSIASKILERYGYSVLSAENGQEAVNVFRAEADTIAAVLLDLTMPVMGGAEAFTLMNEIRPDIPVIISSGYSETMVRGQFSSALAGVIQKPYTVTALCEKMESILASNTAHDSRTVGTSGS
jgi:PAS domain S-box-containing protein